MRAGLEQSGPDAASTPGMYNYLQGIAGRTIQEIEGLDIKLLPETTDQ